MLIYAPKHSSRIQGKIKSRIGKQFGFFRVISYEGTTERTNGDKLALWKAQCICGTIKTVTTNNLVKGNSCGCVRMALRGEKLHRKLTNKKVRAIRVLLAKGTYSQREIAKKFGVSQANISCIHRRAIWFHTHG